MLYVPESLLSTVLVVVVVVVVEFNRFRLLAVCLCRLSAASDWRVEQCK